MRKFWILSLAVAFSLQVGYAQKKAPDNWFNLDVKAAKVPGVSTEKAYAELLKGKTPTQLVVAVIDGGTEVDHEDLAPVIWTNPNEIDGNGIDDDQNGYIDDIHGWNFIGGKNGDVGEDNLEISRVYKALTAKYSGSEAKSGPEYEAYLVTKEEFLKRKDQAQKNNTFYKQVDEAITKIVQSTGKENPTVEDLKAIQSSTPAEKTALDILSQLAKKKVPVSAFKEQIKGAKDYFAKQTEVHLNPDFDGRSVVGDDYANATERIYGNNHYEGPDGGHGTHVAGIIAALRDNNKGMMGVSNATKIMVVRVVPDGDERDKDVANGIRYAVDNGAKIINMSFGKSYSPYKSVVDDAVRYAVSKGVLLIHAAGNDGQNTDIQNNFPNANYADGSGTAATWIEVGASNWQKGKKIPADFSNYGKQRVDLFAPGVDIYSTIPDSKYASFDGTSMASPVTAGVAALVWSYYPTLTAVQVKDVLLQSTIKVKGKVIQPGSGKKKVKVKMTDLCKTGGIVNAYEAIKMAETMTRK